MTTTNKIDPVGNAGTQPIPTLGIFGKVDDSSQALKQSQPSSVPARVSSFNARNNLVISNTPATGPATQTIELAGNNVIVQLENFVAFTGQFAYFNLYFDDRTNPPFQLVATDDLNLVRTLWAIHGIHFKRIIIDGGPRRDNATVLASIEGTLNVTVVNDQAGTFKFGCG